MLIRDNDKHNLDSDFVNYFNSLYSAAALSNLFLVTHHLF